MRRGFKAHAERRSAEVRTDLGLPPHAPIDGWEYARHLGIHVLTPQELGLGGADLHQLLVIDEQSWSGVTIREGDLVGVILNTAHPRTRQLNTLMHEIAHVELRHVTNTVSVSDTGLLLLSDFSVDQEDEANWHAGALLLPRDALLARRAAGRSSSEIAREFGVSEDLCVWRLRMTGVDRQLKFGRRAPF